MVAFFARSRLYGALSIILRTAGASSISTKMPPPTKSSVTWWPPSVPLACHTKYCVWSGGAGRVMFPGT